MDELPHAESVKRFHQATGMGWMAAKQFLSDHSAERCERILRAAEEQSGEYCLHDPIEDDPAFAAKIAAAREEAGKIVCEEIARRKQRSLEASGAGLASLDRPGDISLRTAVIMKKLLLEEGIHWYTPMEMNPGSAF